MPIVLFEDRYVDHLRPVTLGRPAFAITCGGYRLLDLALMLAGSAGLRVESIVRPHLANIVREDLPEVCQPEAIDQSHLSGIATEPTLWLNARLTPSVDTLETLGRLLAAGQPGQVRAAESVAAALVPSAAPRPAGQVTTANVAAYFNQLDLPALEAELPLLEYPHDIIRQHQACFGRNLAHRLIRGDYQQTSDGLFVAEGVKIGAQAVFDTSGGPILLERDVQLGPFCYLCGPAYVGPRARLIEHAVLKDGACLGHTTKIGGEIEASIVEPYTNKQHHGFLGHSYLGSWINWGAGTSNSDLKNTYGQVNMQYGGRKVPSGMQFVGSFVGDYAKTAINTSIFTGKTIGACSMVYGFVTTNVPSFVNYARSFGQVTEAPVEVMIATQARMFARRKVQQRACDIQLLRDMYDLTHDERHQSGEPLQPEPLSL